MASSTESTTSAPRSNSEAEESALLALPHSHTHLNRLAAMGRLFGLGVMDPSKARVLEIGCGEGSNLLPMAEQYPNAHFLGIDSSSTRVAEAHKAITAAGLKNIEVRHQNLVDFAPYDGKFDYVIAHGVFSWVPEPTREKILAICGARLSESGIAYISYNALPGWNMRRSLRDMMLYHTRNFSDPAMKVQQSLALLTFLNESVAGENSAYALHLKMELEFMRSQLVSYVQHDILGQENTPFYFHEFIAGAERHGLQYLGESGLAEMLASNFPEKVRTTLAQLGNDLIRQEQYMDFLRNRTFRQTLLCRKGAAIRRNVGIADMKRFAFRSLLRVSDNAVQLVPGIPADFVSFSGVQVGSADTFVKALLQSLAETGGASAVSYGDLLDITRLRSRPFLADTLANRDALEDEALGRNLLTFLAKGVVEIYAEPVTVSARVPEKPKVSPLVRYQSMTGRHLTNRVHQAIPADLLTRCILEFCDGTRTRDDILGSLVAYVRQDKLQIKEGEQRITDAQRLRGLLAPKVDFVLNAAASGGFFD